MLQDNLKYNEEVKPNTGFLNELKDKLPEFFTANKFDEDGNLVEEGKFDLEKFQRALKEKNINELTSGYQLGFIGKDYAKKQAGEYATTVIVPDKDHNNLEENKKSKNLFFTGDNLEVLRHLQNNYSNSIDVIYIDPPYNTGDDGFIYPDNFEYTDQVLKDMFGLNDKELERLKSIQGKATHSAWLTFMYPRLWLAKRILKESGIMFISINDNEAANLKLLLDEIFGESNLVADLIWSNKEGGGSSDSALFRVKHEHILTVGKNMDFVAIKGVDINNEDRYKLSDEHEIERGKFYLQKLGMGSIQYSKSLDYPIKAPDGTTIMPADNNKGKKACWRWSEDKFEWGLQNDFIVIKKDSSDIWTVYTKQYLKADNNGKHIDRTQRPMGIIDDFSSTQGSKELDKYELGTFFSYPKPTKLIKYLIDRIDNNDIKIVDFFAGSGTTADAVMQLNAEDGGNRQYIMVQIPEYTYSLDGDGTKVPNKGSEAAFNASYLSIDEISRERIKRASKKIQEESGLTIPENFDGGFKHYRVVSPDQPTLDDLESFDIESGFFKNSIGQLVQLPENGFDDMIQPFSSEGLKINGNASGEDTIVTTWLVSDGYKMDVDVESIELNGYRASYVDSSRLYLIYSKWGSEQTKALLNLIGTNQLNVQTIVLYGYSFDLESIREIEIGLKQLNSKVNLLKRY
ncbi:site-specific DNA-methyltransferase [Psychrobacillus sp. NPDC096426]|uniref:site-specific DNA-methyltransferase n=1 Tax=Psychrobacillus sp. NPDC096426 TaxID=3364491 RepID=UPI003813F371